MDMITKIDEYNLYKFPFMNKENAIEIKDLTNEYTGKNVSFFIKVKFARTFRDYECKEIIKNIQSVKNINEKTYKINFNKEDSFIIVTPNQDTYHMSYERLPRRIIRKDKTLQELIDILRKI